MSDERPDDRDATGSDPAGVTATRRAPFISNADKLGYLPPFDGMRGIAVCMVILVHATFEPFGGFAGTVDLFFVLSGFLITTLLLEEDRRAGRVDLRRFYSRRALRLLPLMYLVIVGTLLAALAVHLLTDNRDLLDKAVGDALAGGTYLYHVIHPVHTELVGGGPPEIRPLLHLWSLTVEEHFYLFGALLIIVAIRRNWMRWVAAAFVVGWVAIGLARLTGHVGPLFAWYQRPDSLMLGVVVAFVNARIPARLSDRAGRRLRAGAWVATGVLVATFLVGTWFAKPLGLFVPFLVPEGGSLHDGLFWGEFGFTVIAASVAVMCFTFARYRDHPVARFFSWRPFTELGRRSYAIYLLHVPIGVLLFETVSKVSEGLGLLLYLPVLAVSVELAHRLVERPAMRMRLTLAGAGASGAAAAGVDGGVDRAPEDTTGGRTRPPGSDD